MLLTRDEMRFDFGGHKLDPVRDRDTIAWAVQQFLFGEVTGIQVGHWIYQAPDLDAARFLSKQALEEFQHVGNFLRILEILGVPPGPAHPLLRHLTAISATWEEHVALEMAVGEGLVLQAFYAMIELVDHEEITSILKRGVRQEEGHVDFGEKRTMRAIEGRPWLRRRLLGLALVNLWAIRRFGRFMEKRLPAHPAAAQLPAFLEHTVRAAETRLVRMGVLDRPFAKLSALDRTLLVVEAYAGKALGAIASLVTSPFRLLPWFSRKRLTDTYLDDPQVKRVGALAEHGEDENVEHAGAELTMAVVFETPRALLGQEGVALGETAWLAVTQERVDRFADATLDHQWIHVDPERAKTGPFGTTIAHGYLTLSLVSHFLPQLLEVRGIRMGVNYGCDRVRFPAPVRVGARIRGSAQLVKVEETKDGAIQSTVRVTIEIEGEARPGCVVDTISRWYPS